MNQDPSSPAPTPDVSPPSTNTIPSPGVTGDTVGTQPPSDTPSSTVSSMPASQSASSTGTGGVVSSDNPSGQVTSNTGSAGPQPSGRGKRRSMKAVLVAAVAAVVLIGGGAAAYFGVVVPNKPENQLKQAIQNTIDGKNPAKATKGKIAVNAGGTAVNLDINMLYSDAASQKALADMKLTISGIEIPMEVRYIEGDVYMKAGDLSSLTSILAASADADAAQSKAIVAKLSNQWIKVDKTLLSQAQSNATKQNTTCSTEEISARTREATKEWLTLVTADELQVYTITNTSQDTVDGAATTKFELSVDKAKLMEFGKQAEELPAAQELNKCLGSSSDATSGVSAPEADGEITKFNVWVDGDKNFKRVEVGTKTGSDKSTSETTMDFTFVTDTPAVEKPENAKPFMQLMAELQSSLSGGTTSTTSPLDSLSL